jgi:hypothetical protein
MKAKYAYLCTSGCCRLVKLCSSWDDGATAGNSLENRFPEHLAVTLSRCVGCQECQQIFVPSGHFLILERTKNRRVLSQVNKGDGPGLSLWNEFIVNYPLVIEETHEHGLELRARHARWILCFPVHALAFCFRVVLKAPRVITGNGPINISALCTRSDEMWRRRCF